MVIRKPSKTKSGATVYGWHSNFEILRIDGDVASIVSLEISPNDLHVGDIVFYGITGKLYKVMNILSIGSASIKATISTYVEEI